MQRYYLDNCATTAVAPEVAEAMMSVLRSVPGNPSSIHHEGRQAARIVADSRAVIAKTLGAKPSEIVFTSSGTEANNMAISGLVSRSISMHGRARVVTSTVEHPSVSTRLDWEKRVHGDKLTVVHVGVDAMGLLKLDELEAAITEETILVALLLVNNETGVAQNLDDLKRLKFKQPTVPWLLDAVQAQTKLTMDMRTLPFDMVSFSAHKIYGPKGIAALYIRGGTELHPMLVGGSQEKYRRAGTENIAGIAGYAEAVRLAPREVITWGHLASLEREFLEELQRQQVEYVINGPLSGPRRLPGFINLSFPGIGSREDLQIALDLEGVSLSSTSACHSGVQAESHVLEAMGIEGERRSGAVRILFSRYHVVEDAVAVAQRVATVTRRMLQAVEAG